MNKIVSYDTKNLTCPVCWKELLESSDGFLECTTSGCGLYRAEGEDFTWQFLHAAIDQNNDAVQEARKAIARLGRENDL